MANTRSAAKRARQTGRRTAANRRTSRGVKSALKTARESIQSGDKTSAVEGARKAASALDKAAKTGRLHPNKANRLKSRLSKAVATVS